MSKHRGRCDVCHGRPCILRRCRSVRLGLADACARAPYRPPSAHAPRRSSDTSLGVRRDDSVSSRRSTRFDRARQPPLACGPGHRPRRGRPPSVALAASGEPTLPDLSSKVVQAVAPAMKAAGMPTALGAVLGTARSFPALWALAVVPCASDSSTPSTSSPSVTASPSPRGRGSPRNVRRQRCVALCPAPRACSAPSFTAFASRIPLLAVRHVGGWQPRQERAGGQGRASSSASPSFCCVRPPVRHDVLAHAVARADGKRRPGGFASRRLRGSRRAVVRRDPRGCGGPAEERLQVQRRGSRGGAMWASTRDADIRIISESSCFGSGRSSRAFPPWRRADGARAFPRGSGSHSSPSS